MAQLSHEAVNMPQQLNDMLDWFCIYENSRKEHSHDAIFKAVLSRNKQLSSLVIDISGIMEACLNKLIKDNYVEKHVRPYVNMDTGEESTVDRYRITYDGLLFKQNGGYKVQQEKERNLKRLGYLERTLLALGAIFGTVYGISEFFQKSEYRNILISVVLSAVAALLVLIALQERKKR